MLAFHEIINSFSRISPDKLVVSDHSRELTYAELSFNGTNLAYFFKNKGIKKGDRVALIAYNCIEFSEIIYATSMVEAILLPINFRLSSDEIIDIFNDANPIYFIYQNEFSDIVDVLTDKKYMDIKNCLSFKSNDKEYSLYYDIISDDNFVDKSFYKTNLFLDWSLMYTSGTTGKPKGVVRNQKSYFLMSAITAIELKIKRTDKALLVMPLCHANSFNFFYAYIFSGASIHIYSKYNFDANYFFKVIQSKDCNFTSLVPTHFIMILDYLKNDYKTNNIKNGFKFMISSAPVRKDTKEEILKYFKNACLYELYGSSESGWVTMLHPEEQFTHLGTVGKECIASKPIILLDKNFNEVEDGKIGELYASPPYNFSYYWNNKNKTNEAFFNDYVSVGDLALRTKDGYIKLIDRKNNMIISGGENVYPSEVENIIGQHVDVKDVAVIGSPNKKWGEIVCAFVVLVKNKKLDKKDLIFWAKSKIASYKCPKKIIFIDDNQMPRNAVGKILHNVLKEKLIELKGDNND